MKEKVSAMGICPECGKRVFTCCKQCIEAGTGAHPCANGMDAVDGIKYGKPEISGMKEGDLIFIEGEGEFEVIKTDEEGNALPSEKKVEIYDVAYLHSAECKSAAPDAELRIYENGNIEFVKTGK